VRTIGTEREDTAIVAAVIALAHNLELAVVSEGVETPEQLAVLLQLQCHYLQGYLFSPPRPAADVAEILAMSPFRVITPSSEQAHTPVAAN
jgi:EAL domain-containing protein (putative c-di-GMP-specific phosphodiesterase class I)